MARIRTIKPEFPQSESMGRVSRDARLLFVMLWPICDDHGRTRAASRMLASLLFPYDDDAPSLIDGWLAELQDEGCVRLYESDGSRYLEVCNWLKHQKIDKPSKPVFPEFVEESRILASPRESSLLDQGSGTKDQGRDQGASPVVPTGDERAVLEAYHDLLPSCQRIAVLNPKRKRRIAAAVKMAKAVCREQGWEYDAEDFWRAYFTECTGDPWLRGERANPNNPTWKQNLDVLLAEDRFAGIMDRAIDALRASA